MLKTRLDVIDFYKSLEIPEELYKGVDIKIISGLTSKATGKQVNGKYINLSVRSNTPVIYIRAGRSEDKMKYTALHELGHRAHYLYKPTHIKVAPHEWKENYADTFARKYGYKSAYNEYADVTL